MSFGRISIALPAASLGDIPSDLGEHQAANLLATWTAMWHPRLLAQSRRLPDVSDAESLIGGPPTADTVVLVPAISVDHLGESAVLHGYFQQHPSQLPAVHSFARRCQVISQLGEQLAMDLTQPPDATADFYALGYAALQIERLTRSMHYQQPDSLEAFERAVVQAADAALAGDQATLAERLTSAYDHLMQCRTHYYPIDFYLIDLGLTAPSIAGVPLRQECASADESNLLVTGELLDHLSAEQPETLAELRDALEAGRVCVCGGSRTGQPLADLPPEMLREQLVAGTESAQRHLGVRLSVFAHPAGPMAPLVPGLLRGLGYRSAVLSNFSGGPLPNCTSSRTTWNGLDNTQLDALAAEPVDAGSHAAMFSLSTRIHDAMNYDLAAAVLLAGWPGHRTEWHADLRQAGRRTNLLGKFIKLDDYFELSSSHDSGCTLPPEAYSAGDHRPIVPPAPDDPHQVLTALAGGDDPSPRGLAEQLGCDTSQPAAGQLWINTSSLSRTLHGGELPAFGWRWEPAPAADPPPRAEPGRLRNELLEVVFDERTGGISATRMYARRGNLLSQHLAIAGLGPQGLAAGLQLAMDGWQVAESSREAGVLVTNYRVVDRDGKSLAALEQRTTLAQQSLALELQVTVEPLSQRAEFVAIASRIAVPDADFRLTRGLQGIDLPTQRRQVRAAWVGIAGGSAPMAVLCDAPRLHRRHAGSMLDTALVEATGEKSSVALSYWLDCRCPAQAWSAWQHPAGVSRMAAGPSRQVAGWWLRISAANVQLTHLSVERAAGGQLLRIRLLETAGRQTHTKLAAWRALTEAQTIAADGSPEMLLRVVDGSVQMEFAPYEYMELVAAVDGPP